MLKVLLDTSPLESGHAHRGIGSYTRQLQQALQASKQVSLLSAADLDQAAVIHYPYFDFFQHSLKIIANIPTVVTIHDVIPLKYPTYYPVGIRGKIAFWQQKNALRQVSAIVTDSHSSKVDIMDHLQIADEQIFVIPLAADPQLTHVSDTTQKKVRQKYQLPDKYVLYVGDINYNKNLPELVAAMKHLPADLQLVMVGKNMRPQSIPEWQRIQDQISSDGVESRVQFVTNVDSGMDLAAIYSAASVYVQSSLAEGFGLPILEAMQCLTPVVVYDHSSMAEVSGAHAIKVDQPNATHFARAIDQIINWSPAQRRKATSAAHTWATNFTWEKTATQTIAVYHHIT